MSKLTEDSDDILSSFDFNLYKPSVKMKYFFDGEKWLAFTEEEFERYKKLKAFI